MVAVEEMTRRVRLLREVDDEHARYLWEQGIYVSFGPTLRDYLLLMML